MASPRLGKGYRQEGTDKTLGTCLEREESKPVSYTNVPDASQYPLRPVRIRDNVAPLANSVGYV
jgi:hypothetical protein